MSSVAPATAERIRLRLTVPRTYSRQAKVQKVMAAQTIEAVLQTEHHMIEKDLEFLGGVEYKALKLLRLIVFCVRPPFLFIHEVHQGLATVSYWHSSSWILSGFNRLLASKVPACI
jgi:hypothetical protein